MQRVILWLSCIAAKVLYFPKAGIKPVYLAVPVFPFYILNIIITIIYLFSWLTEDYEWLQRTN